MGIFPIGGLTFRSYQIAMNPTNTSPLSADRELYDSQGYLVVPGLFSAEDLAPVHDQFLRVVNGEEPPAPDMLVMKDVMVTKGAVTPASAAEAIAKVQDFHRDPVLFRRAISTHYASAECQFLPGAEPVGKARPYLLVRGREHEGCI